MKKIYRAPFLQKKKKKLKDIVKSIKKYPFDNVEEERDHFHPDVELEIREQMEKDELKKEEEVKQNKIIEIEGTKEESRESDPEYDLTMGDYPDDEMPYEFDPTKGIIEDFQEGVNKDYIKNISGTKQNYSESEKFVSEVEKLEIKYLEKLGVLPDPPLKYVDPLRKQLKKIFLGNK